MNSNWTAVGSTRSGRPYRRRGHRGYYDSIRECQLAHPKIFQPEAHLSFYRRPVIGSDASLLQTILRVPSSYTDREIRQSILQAFFALQEELPANTNEKRYYIQV